MFAGQIRPITHIHIRVITFIVTWRPHDKFKPDWSSRATACGLHAIRRVLLTTCGCGCVLWTVNYILTYLTVFINIYEYGYPYTQMVINIFLVSQRPYANFSLIGPMTSSCQEKQLSVWKSYEKPNSYYTHMWLLMSLRYLESACQISAKLVLQWTFSSQNNFLLVWLSQNHIHRLLITFTWVLTHHIPYFSLISPEVWQRKKQFMHAHTQT